SLLFLALVAAVCLGLNLLFLTVYLVCLCCCRRDAEPQSKRPDSCCVTWTAVVAGLVCCAAVGAGSYGNSEANDGVSQLLYALDSANHSLSAIDALVGPGPAPRAPRPRAAASREPGLHPGRLPGDISPAERGLCAGLGAGAGAHAACSACESRGAARARGGLCSAAVAARSVPKAMARARSPRRMLCCGLLTLILSWASTAVDVAAAVGTSDFCVAPDKFILNVTESELSAGRGGARPRSAPVPPALAATPPLCFAEVLHYYVYCEQSRSSPFQQALTVLQRSLTTMQGQVQALEQLAVPLFPAAEPELLATQRLLNGSESGLQRLTALLDCRGLHKDYLDALMGICYDGVEGLLYLLLFSLLVAAAFSTVICAAPRAWRHLAARDRHYDDMDEEDPFNPQARRIAAHNPARGQLRSFCSYSSSLGSQSSLHPPAQTISNAPVSEYMNQAALFGGNPRYENVPLIGRGSPPPTYSPSMRATYLSVGEERARHGAAELPA
ncbi:TTYH2 protein, partial [Crypturellus soui]|nr:TTYH2 protein [Crypturellus soui]